jgi:hypothetical protein
MTDNPADPLAGPERVVVWEWDSPGCSERTWIATYKDGPLADEVFAGGRTAQEAAHNLTGGRLAWDLRPVR